MNSNNSKASSNSSSEKGANDLKKSRISLFISVVLATKNKLIFVQKKLFYIQNGFLPNFILK
jgi:hypothetical protein